MAKRSQLLFKLAGEVVAAARRDRELARRVDEPRQGSGALTEAILGGRSRLSSRAAESLRELGEGGDSAVRGAWFENK